MNTIQRVFIANRGEIAARLIRACRALNLETVLAVSEADKESPPARMADRAVCIGPASASQSYLRHDLIITAAVATGCQAIHPGYGFLSERAVFAQACHDHGLIFIGPSPQAIEQMGDKLNAIALAKLADVPVIPGSGELQSWAQAREAADDIGYPCLIKASAGGGGRGMRVVQEPGDLRRAFDSARAEAQSAFGDATVYMERFIQKARHIEIQILGDHHGNIVHLFERDCSVQRRHQKLIEESPSPVLPEKVRQDMAKAALALARAVNYVNAGTVEFVYDAATCEFYFLEMNTRIQVEHPVTEMVTGIDLVQEQIRIAAGLPLSFTQDDVRLRGHAIECRLNAEDPQNGFVPSPGRLQAWSPPTGEGLRLDTHCEPGYLIPPYYDSMVGKLIAFGQNRDTARLRLLQGLESLQVQGIQTTRELQSAILAGASFTAGDVSTRWLEQEFLPAWLALETMEEAGQ